MAIKPKLQIDGEDVVGEVKELQKYAEAGVTIGLAAGATNVCTVTVQSVDGLGAPLAGVQLLDLYFSNSAVGANITPTTYSGSLVATTGAILATVVAAKVFTVLTDATGKFVGSLTATAKPVGEYVVVRRQRGDLVVSAPTATVLFG